MQQPKKSSASTEPEPENKAIEDDEQLNLLSSELLSTHHIVSRAKSCESMKTSHRWMRILWKVNDLHQIRNCLTIYCHILEGRVAVYDDFEDSGINEYINKEGPESESDDDMAVEEEEEETKQTKQTKTKKHGHSDILVIRNTTAASRTPTITVSV